MEQPAEVVLLGDPVRGEAGLSEAALPILSCTPTGRLASTPALGSGALLEIFSIPARCGAKKANEICKLMKNVSGGRRSDPAAARAAASAAPTKSGAAAAALAAARSRPPCKHLNSLAGLVALLRFNF